MQGGREGQAMEVLGRIGDETAAERRKQLQQKQANGKEDEQGAAAAPVTAGKIQRRTGDEAAPAATANGRHTRSGRAYA